MCSVSLLGATDVVAPDGSFFALGTVIMLSSGCTVVLSRFAGWILKSRMIRFLMTSFLFLVSGLTTGLSIGSPPVNDMSRWASRRALLPVTLSGTMINSRVVVDSVTSFDLVADSMCYIDACRHVAGSAYVHVDSEPLSVKTGYRDRAHIRFRGWLSRPQTSGTFDQESWLWQRSVYSVVSPFPLSFSVLRSAKEPSLFSRLRLGVIRRIDRTHATPGIQALLRAMITGDRSGLNKEVRRSFRYAGASHLLAVSGLHVGIIAFVCFILVTSILSRLSIEYAVIVRLRAWVVLCGLVLFSFVAGSGPSVIRGSIMAAVYLVQTGREESSLSWDVLALSGLGILAFDPASLFSAGFQLSFVAVAALIVAHDSAESAAEDPAIWRRMTRRWIVRPLRMSGYILAATAPILYVHFDQVILAGIVTNLITIPFFGLFFISGICSTILGSIGQIAVVTDVLGRLFLAVISSLAEWSDPVGGMGPNVHEWLALIFCIASISLLGRCAARRKRFALVTIGLVLFVVSIRIDRSSDLSAIVIDVGQGDASLIRFPSGQTLLVDSGPGPVSADRILHHLSLLGARRLDTVIISHFHRDHTGGLQSLIRRVPVGRIIVSGQTNTTELQRLRPYSIGERLALAGDTVLVSPDAYLAILGPPRRRYATGQSSQMLVIMIRFGRVSLLFPGDLEASGERELIASYGPLLSAELVKVAHHGSKTSSSIPFVSRTALSGTTWTVISAGKRNAFGHPDPEVVRRWITARTRLWITSRRGSFSFRSDGYKVVESGPHFSSQ